MQLSNGALQSIMNGEKLISPILRVLSYKALQSSNSATRYRLNVTDDVTSNSFVMLSTQLNEKIESHELVHNSIIRFDNYIIKNQSDKKIIVLLELTVMKEGATNAAPQLQVQQIVNEVQPQRVFPAVHANFGKVILISMINSYQNKWAIEGRVSQKSVMRNYSNAKGEGKLFNFVLCDQSCDIKITAFNNEATKFFDVIEIGKIYVLTKGNVKPVNINYRNTKSDFEITLNSESEICEVPDKMEIPKMQLDFVSIDTIAEKQPDTFIDIVGVAHSIMEISSVLNKTTNKESLKREVVLVDRSAMSIRLTLWGNEAYLLDGLVHPVLVVKSAVVKEFNGRSLSCGSSSTVLINPPDIPEAMALVGWYNDIGNTINFKTQQGGSGGLQLQTKIATIATLNCDIGSEKPEYFSLEAAICQFKRENLVYKACTTERCNKKVINLPNGMYKCEKCNLESSDCAFRLILNMQIIDVTGAQWVTSFQDVSQLVLGRSAEEIGAMIDQEEKEDLDVMFKEALFISYEFKLRIKCETYNDETRMRVTTVDCKPIDILNSIDRLIDLIEI